jgi:hypothetical protein
VKVILLYALLVGLPIIGVAGVLQLGQNLKPPVSAGGSWEVQVDSQFSHTPSCKYHQRGVDRLALNISQSGRRLVATFRDSAGDLPAELDGEIDGRKVTADAIGLATGDPGWRFATGLTASVERQPDGDRLVGVLTLECCRPRTEATFVASRQYKTHKTSEVH